MNTYYVAGIPFDGIDAIFHYGIPLMEWHKRRFQYENGRLTPEGKERYRKMRSDKRKNADNEVGNE